MIYINVIMLMVVSAALGYFIGVGKIVITKKVKLTPQEAERLEAMEKEQQEAIDKYNQMIRNINNYTEVM